MNKQDLLEKELSNLYAINKQIDDHFDGKTIPFFYKEHQSMMADYLRYVDECKRATTIILNRLKINPANTTDSIVAEITENLDDILNKDLNDEVKSAGYLMSLNRLLGYQVANLENIAFIASGSADFGALKRPKHNFQLIQEALFDLYSAKHV